MHVVGQDMVGGAHTVEAAVARWKWQDRLASVVLWFLILGALQGWIWGALMVLQPLWRRAIGGQ